MTHEDEPLERKTEPAALDEDIPFDDFESGGGFKAALDKNPALKIGLIVGVVILLIIAFMMFGKGSKEKAPISMIRPASSTVSGSATDAKVSPAYKQAIAEKNAQNVEAAMKNGGSAIPISTTPGVSAVPAVPTTPTQEDPLERWRRIESDRAKQDQAAAKPAPAAGQQADPSAQAIKDLANAMSQQMQSVLQSIKVATPVHQTWTDPKTVQAEEQAAATAATTAAATQAAQTAGGTPITIIEPIGAIAYAQMITEANSDVNGPVLAQIVGGPLAGARAIGSFQKEQNRFLVIKFSSVIIDGIGHSTEGYALDPATNLTALVTDVDHRYFDRIVIPAAAAFIEGMGSAIAATGSTVDNTASSTTVSTPKLNTKQQIFAGIATAGQQASSVLTQDANQTEVLVRVAAGTPMGILFTQPVTDQQQ